MFQKMLVVDGITGCVDFTIKMMISLLYTFCLHFCLINIHIFDYHTYIHKLYLSVKVFS